MKKSSFVDIDIHPVMLMPDDVPSLDFSAGFDINQLKDRTWGVGGYSERRPGMYLAPQYKNERFIHMGVDFWAPAGHPVFSIYDGAVAYIANHQQEGNYGPTLILHHNIGEADIFALYGHLSKKSIEKLSIGQAVKKGERVADLGEKSENGDWHPHLHYQISIKDPGEADMPGVVSEEDLAEAQKIYPDPRIVLGSVY
ncbi:MAG: peptidoglycan DD-metalloendopeptidase family protein [Balneolaceae bacterium]